jgi:poly-gamma-glutamate capsule biosynthesis protein CapA/YwtB (metallophosphatase superfamily)
MKRAVLLLLCLLAIAARGQETARTISGRITDDHGAPIPGARIEVGGQRVESGADGDFVVTANLDMPATLRFSADGHYEAVQTFGRSDVAAADGDIGSIALVARRPGRRLLLFAGDAMLARRFFEPLAGEPVFVRRDHVLEDGKALLAQIKPYVELADFASVNMETQLSSTALNDRLPKSITFYSPAEFAEILEWAGFDYVALGNNHTWDYQEEGLASTLDALAKTSLRYSGAGFDERSARAAHVAAGLQGKPMAFLSYVGWSGTFSPHQAAEGDKGGAALGSSEAFAVDLRNLPTKTTKILQFHSGLEYSDVPAMSERTRLREAIDFGAAVAVGHHAHILQGLEIYRNRLIAYSMGNFLFDQTYYTTQLGMLLYVWLDGDELHRAEVVPMYVNGYAPTPATGAMRYSILNRMARLSRDLGTCLRPNGAHLVTVACAGEEPARVDLPPASPGPGPIPLAMLGIAPHRPVALTLDGYRYRLGTDILRRGDFEAYGQFGIPGRGWLVGDAVAVVDGDSQQLEVTVPENETVRTGMSAFQRVFTLSNPTTLAGRVYADGPAVIRFQLQRRQPATSMSEALATGPIHAVGGLRIETAGWHRFAVDFDQPRVQTESLRLLIDVTDDQAHPGGVSVRFDDLAWVEWSTPWLGADEGLKAPQFATHVQFRPEP